MMTYHAARLYIDIDEPVRFRVDSVEWQDVRPIPVAQTALTNGDANGHEEVPQKDPLETAGYKIMVSSSCRFPVRVKDSGSF